MPEFQEIGTEIGHWLTPIFVIMVASIFGVVMWNLANSIAAYARMRAVGYTEREEIYINGNRAVITKIGLLSTSLLMLNGEGVLMKWAEIPNNRLSWQKIERISLKIGMLDHWTPRDGPKPEK